MQCEQNSMRPFGQRPDGSLTISYFCAPAERVFRTYVEWGREVGIDFQRISPVRVDWREFLGEYVTPPNSGLLSATQGEWCAFVDNDRIGSLPFSDLVVIAERTRSRSAAFICQDLNKCRSNGAPYTAMFAHCDATRGTAEHRYVSVFWNGPRGGGWEFDETGAPLLFEETAAYALRKKADRLTPDMLERYARALGIVLPTAESLTSPSAAIGLRWQSVSDQPAEAQMGLLQTIGEKINRGLGIKAMLNIYRTESR